MILKTVELYPFVSSPVSDLTHALWGDVFKDLAQEERYDFLFHGEYRWTLEVNGQLKTFEHTFGTIVFVVQNNLVVIAINPDLSHDLCTYYAGDLRAIEAEEESAAIPVIFQEGNVAKEGILRLAWTYEGPK